MAEGPGGHSAPLIEPAISQKIKLRQFKVLMWKHLIVRKNKFIATLFELISPCFFFIILVVLQHTIMPNIINNRTNINLSETIHKTETISFEKFRPPGLILYTPESDYVNKFMDKVGQKLKLSRLDSLPSSKSLGYVGCANITSTLRAVNDFINDDNKMRYTAIVIFENMDGETWPKKLNYTIHTRADLKVYTYAWLDDDGGSHMNNYGTMYDTFMRLQWAIDSSYISILSNDNITQSVSLQEFPSSTRDDADIYSFILSIVRMSLSLSLLLPFIFLLVRLQHERASGIQELMRMAGVSKTLLTYSHMANMAATGLVYSVCGTIVFKVPPHPWIPNCDGFLIFLMLVFHFTSIMALAFVCSFFTKTAQYATTLALFCYMVSSMPTLSEHLLDVTGPLMYLTGFLPHMPMAWFWNEVDILEKAGEDLDWSSMWTAHSQKSGSAALAMAMLVLQTALFMQLAWYLSAVLPGKYGVRQPWNFLCKRSYWLREKLDPVTALDEEVELISTKDPRFFEEPVDGDTWHHDVGIRISNVYKTFGKDAALTNVSFDVYKGEITVLLGHNGAGKTTLMSIITGTMSATAGTVKLSGVSGDAGDVGDAGDTRGQLGVCPQNNLFFPDLTVMHHLLFFAMLRGSTYKEACKSSKQLLSRLGIEAKANSWSDELSGGMKRRLQLACALSGGASVLILDEPTSGLDVETRRELWDLLLANRGNRTVLLSTHFMEEADALGDRVAALHGGRLKCHATPMYLKRNIGTGYRLSLTTVGLPKEVAITHTIASVLPGATIKESSYNSVSYNLPAEQSNDFPALFSELEANRTELGIDSIGVGVSSLEEVFLKLCSDVDTKFTKENVDSSAPEPKYSRIRGLSLYVRQLNVLMKRQMRYIIFNRTKILILQVILPISILFLVIQNQNTPVETQDQNTIALSLNMDLFKDMSYKRVLYKAGPGYEDAVNLVQKANEDFKFEKSDDVAKSVLYAAQQIDLTEYSKYLVGFEINKTDAKVLYSAKISNAAPVTLNLLSNTLAAKYVTWSDGRTITTNYQQLEGHIRRHGPEMKEPKNSQSCVEWVVFVVFFICGAVMNSVTLPIKELASGTRHIHTMSGCPPAVHWLATLVFHVTFYTVTLVLPIAAITQIDMYHTLSRPDFVGALILTLMLGSAAYLSLCYLCSFSFSERGAGLILTVAIVFTGLFPGLLHSFDTATGFWSFAVDVCNWLVPTATMTSALTSAVMVAVNNSFCELNLDKCPNIVPTGGLAVDETCCALKKATACILCMDGKAPGAQLIILTLQLLVYMVLVILTQYGLFNNWYDRLVNKNYRPRDARFSDEMVRAEETYVSHRIQLPPKEINDAMLVKDLHKNFFSLLHPKSPVNAVKGVSFSLKKGECFGLLGVNGAGKSTTFKMISGEECPTRGGVFANGQHLKWPRSQYLQSLGYCPQFFGLDEFLSGQENLALLLTLRGLEEKDVRAETDAWIEVVGLERYQNLLVEGYSGGCMRRLATAAALSSGAPVTLLDEPTSGVDVSARRRVWVALRKGLRQNRAVIITSHSMDEMEALCDRIAIMSGGELGALGSPCSLRAAHAAGHALVLKLGGNRQLQDDEFVDSVQPVNILKAYLKQKFNCSLKDEHKTMLHYHINETMRYSELFSALEQLKQQFPHIIEDYSVTETTLEEVFLSFAQPPAPPPAEPYPV